MGNVICERPLMKQESMRIDSKIASRLHRRNIEMMYWRKLEICRRFGQHWFIGRIGRTLRKYLVSAKCNICCVGAIE